MVEKGPIKIRVLGKSGSGGMKKKKKEEAGDKWVGGCKRKDKMEKESVKRKGIGERSAEISRPS